MPGYLQILFSQKKPLYQNFCPISCLGLACNFGRQQIQMDFRRIVGVSLFGLAESLLPKIREPRLGTNAHG
jgi:hypothetical protein